MILEHREKEVLDIIRKEASKIKFGGLDIGLIIKDGRIVRVETSTTKKAYKI